MLKSLEASSRVLVGQAELPDLVIDQVGFLVAGGRKNILDKKARLPAGLVVFAYGWSRRLVEEFARVELRLGRGSAWGSASLRRPDVEKLTGIGVPCGFAAFTSITEDVIGPNAMEISFCADGRELLELQDRSVEAVLPRRTEHAHVDAFLSAGGAQFLRRGSTTIIDGFDDLIITGWALSSSSVSLAENIYVLLDGIAFPAEYGMFRPDITAAWPAAPANTGFSVSIPAEALTRGTHTVQVLVEEVADREWSVSSSYVIESHRQGSMLQYRPSNCENVARQGELVCYDSFGGVALAIDGIPYGTFKGPDGCSLIRIPASSVDASRHVVQTLFGQDNWREFICA